MVLVLAVILLPRGPAETESPKPWYPSTKSRSRDEDTPKSPACLLWLVGTGTAFYPSPWPSASKWASISAFVKAINRAVQA